MAEIENIGKNKKAQVKAALERFITVHEVKAGETLGALALEYYGHATEKYWRLIYEENKAKIGDNPNKLASGLKLNIPELPADLK